MMEEKVFEQLNDMFQHEGWKHFVETATELRETLEKGAPDYAVTNDQWQYTRGKIHQLNLIVGYEQYIKAVWEQKENDNKDEEDGEILI